MARPDSSDLWTLLETPPDGAEAVADLWHWSSNFDAGKGPATLFLDLIGWSEEHLGVNLYSGIETGYGLLGIVEIAKLGAAMTEYANDPNGVREYVSALLEAEDCDD